MKWIDPPVTLQHVQYCCDTYITSGLQIKNKLLLMNGMNWNSIIIYFDNPFTLEQ